MADYAKYSHVRRLGTAGTEDYLKGTVIATPKVDGANCCVYLDEETQTPAIGGRYRPVEDKTDIAWLGDWFDTDKRGRQLFGCVCLMCYTVYKGKQERRRQ